MKRPEEVNLSRAEGEALIERVKANTLSEEDRRVVVKLIELWFWLSFALTEAKLSLKRLKGVLFGRGRGAGDDDESGPPRAGVLEIPGALATEQGSPSEPKVPPSRSLPSAEAGDKPSKPPPPGHGRHGVQAYTGAEVVTCRHETLRAGERCPACGRGTLYRLPPGVEVRIDGQALLSALRYELAGVSGERGSRGI
jgi:hypothetical protein